MNTLHCRGFSPRRSFSFPFGVTCLFMASACGSQEIRLQDIKLPPGFQIAPYATGVNGARSLTLAPTRIEEGHAVKYEVFAEGRLKKILWTFR